MKWQFFTKKYSVGSMYDMIFINFAQFTGNRNIKDSLFV